MAVKLKRFSTNADVQNSPEWIDESFDQAETTVDGQTFHWGANQTRNLADDGVAKKHIVFASGNATGTVNVTLNGSEALS